jgi:hypothetical protein
LQDIQLMPKAAALIAQNAFRESTLAPDRFRDVAQDSLRLSAASRALIEGPS